jgi:hypothetical protein
LVGALVLLGGLGIFTGAWELQNVYQLPLAGMSQESRANLLNQYGYLKAIELGFGLFSLLFRKEIFKVPAFNRLFLAVVFVGVAARVLAIVVNGWPHWSFTGITVFELAAGIVVALYSRSTLERS